MCCVLFHTERNDKNWKVKINHNNYVDSDNNTASDTTRKVTNTFLQDKIFTGNMN